MTLQPCNKPNIVGGITNGADITFPTLRKVGLNDSVCIFNWAHNIAQNKMTIVYSPAIDWDMLNLLFITVLTSNNDGSTPNLTSGTRTQYVNTGTCSNILTSYSKDDISFVINFPCKLMVWASGSACPDQDVRMARVYDSEVDFIADMTRRNQLRNL